MLRSKRLSFLFVMLALLVSVLSCSNPVGRFFPTPTPTASSTPTPTLTPTVTPMPPISLRGCAYYDLCPEIAWLGDFAGGEIHTGQIYHADVPFDLPVRLTAGWCALNDERLQDNVEKLEFFFTVDGSPYTNDLQVEYGFDSDGNPCIYAGVVMSNWQLGETHRIELGYEITEELNDGWGTYLPETKKYVFDVNPVIPPTETPTPTATPTQRVNTLPPACDASATINIQNDTGGVVSITLTGPGYFTFNLSTGGNTLWVCPGTYTYSAWGCGSFNSGTLNSGESHTFYCQ